MKQNTITIITIVAIIGFVAGGIYLLAGIPRGSAGDTTRTDSMHGGDAVATSGSLNDLVGKPVPAFLLRDRNGVEYSAGGLKGKNVVLFFNEGIMCYPACWNQMVALATDTRFTGSDMMALSVVIDQPSDWQRAIEKMPELGKANVLFDTSKSVSQAFGMLTMPSSMHYGSFPGHSFIVIDKQGVVRSVFDDQNMGIDNDRIFTELNKLN